MIGTQIRFQIDLNFYPNSIHNVFFFNCGCFHGIVIFEAFGKILKYDKLIMNAFNWGLFKIQMVNIAKRKLICS